MSYNIDTFKVKKLDSLIIPVASLYNHVRKDFHPKKKLGEEDDSYIRFAFGESVFIEGPVINESIHVKSIDWTDEFSGTAMDEVFEPALEDSTGQLIAFCVWEGGDTINQLRVRDGKVEWVDIDI
jgi:hypothetical protein